MSIIDKLKFFGKKSDLKVPEAAVIILDEMVKTNHELFESLKAYIYAKMTLHARKLSKKGSDTLFLQGAIAALDEIVLDLENIEKFADKEEEDLTPTLRGQEILKKLVGIHKNKVASGSVKKYTLDDYLESKDFDGKLDK